jgi:hypothetical protein
MGLVASQRRELAAARQPARWDECTGGLEAADGLVEEQASSHRRRRPACPPRHWCGRGRLERRDRLGQRRRHPDHGADDHHPGRHDHHGGAHNHDGETNHDGASDDRSAATAADDGSASSSASPTDDGGSKQLHAGLQPVHPTCLRRRLRWRQRRRAGVRLRARAGLRKRPLRPRRRRRRHWLRHLAPTAAGPAVGQSAG